MKNRPFMIAGGLLLLTLTVVGVHETGWSAFLSRGTVALTMSVTIGQNGGSTPLTITADPLPAQALFGKNMMVPVTITSNGAPIVLANLRVDVVYQLVDASGAALGPIISVPIQFIPSTNNGTTLQGTAVVNRSDLAPVQAGGTIRYVFRARQGASDSVLGSGGMSQVPAGGNVLASPFQTSIVDQFCSPVTPAGARVSAPDLAARDGRTAVTFQAGALSQPGTLCIRAENDSLMPAGPLGARAAAIYSIQLNGATLTQPAEIVLSYPADLNGKVAGSGADPKTLGIYWLDDTRLSGDWRVLSRSNLDTTLHTLTGQTGHFSVFGLFPAGAIGSPQLRPAERIVTPNGDGINDRVTFGSGIDDVKIFDVRGRRVKTIAGPAPIWDGTDDSGAIVESGVYVYQYMASGERVSGVIGVAK